MRILIVVAALFLAACESNSEAARVENDGRQVAATPDGETVVALDRVPAAVMAAGEKAVPGIEITGAEREVEDGVVVYDLRGTANGKVYEIEVTAAGKVLEVEDEDDADEDGDDDDDED